MSEETLIRVFIKCPHCKHEYYVTYVPDHVYICKSCRDKFVVRMYFRAEKPGGAN